MSNRIDIHNSPKPKRCPECATSSPNTFIDNGASWTCSVCGHTERKITANPTSRVHSPERRMPVSPVATRPTINSRPTAPTPRQNWWQQLSTQVKTACITVLIVVLIYVLAALSGWIDNRITQGEAQRSTTQSPTIELTSSPMPSESFTEYKSANYVGGYYEGEWIDDVPNGLGTFTFPNGSVYFGGFVNGDFHGNGKITWDDGSWFDGEWLNGERTEIGLYVHTSGMVSYDGLNYPWFYGASTGLLKVEVDIETPGKVFLVDEENFLKYLNEQEYTYYGGECEAGTVKINVKGSQRYYLVVYNDGGSYTYRHSRDGAADILDSGKTLYNGYNYPWFYGSTSKSLMVEIDIDVPCNVILLEEEDFLKYLNGQGYSYYGGDYEPGTVTLRVRVKDKTKRLYLNVASEERGTYIYRYYR